MTLTDTQRAFVYGEIVLKELEKAGAGRVSLRIYADASCSLILPSGTNEDIMEMSEQLLASRAWVKEDIFYLRLDTTDGLLIGADAMEISNA